MEEPTINDNDTTDKLRQKNVLLFIRSNYFKLLGNWQWDLETDAVFCSDVIFSNSTSFNGTKSIIHPEDLPKLLAGLSFLEEQKTIDIQFRIITTYGMIKTLTGEKVALAEEEYNNDQEGTYLETNLLEEEKKRIQLNKEISHWHLKSESYQHTERLAETGAWHINATTGETVYSDQVFRIYGLQPQSLNMHPHTFFSFIHTEDQAVVINTFEKAYQQKLPLDIEFKIIRADGKERYVQQTLQWSLSKEGASILHVVIRDVTEQKEMEQMINQAQDDFQFLDKIFKNQEQESQTGHWYMNMLVRKTVFSDNFYRILGLKPQSILLNFNLFLKFVHPEDHDIVQETMHKARHEHAPFEIEYRIIRQDGKIRNIRQTGKMEIYGHRELMLIGNIKDITQQRILEEKINKHFEDQTIQKFIQDNIEERARIGSLVWDLQSDKVIWSDYLYTLLGYKSSALNPSAKLILKFIHPAHISNYKNELSLVMQGQEREEFNINILVKSEVRNLKVKLTLMTYKGLNFLVGTFKNITEELTQNTDAQKHIQLAEQLTENFPDRIMVTDNNYSFVVWNNACEDKYKRKKDAVVGLNFFDVFPEYKTEEILDHFHDVFEGKTVHQHLLATPTRGYDDWHMFPLYNKNDDVIGILHILKDVTGDFKLKQQLNERLNLIESLVDSSIDRIIALDKNMNYLYWNRKSEEYYGLKKEQVIGKNILEVFPGLLNDPSYNEFKKAVRGETVRITESAPSENGHYFETYLVPVKNEKEEVNVILWITHDFTKERRLPAEQMVAANQILDTVDEVCFELDKESRLIYVNKKAVDFFQISGEEILGKVLWDVYPKIKETSIYDLMKKTRQENIPAREVFISPKDGSNYLASMTPTAEGLVVILFTFQVPFHINHNQP